MPGENHHGVAIRFGLTPAWQGRFRSLGGERMRIVAFTLAVCLLASTAWSAPWTVLDLGRVHREAHCLDAARQSFRDLLAEARITALRSSSWVIYADGINDAHDALISCTYGDNRGTRATLVIHSSGRPVDAHLLKRRIANLFQGHARRITQAWIDSYN